MRILNRKTPLQRFLDSVNDTLDVPDGLRFDLPRGGPGKALKAGLIAAGGLAGLTAGERRDSRSGTTRRGRERFVKLVSVAVFAAGYIIGPGPDMTGMRR